MSRVNPELTHVMEVFANVSFEKYTEYQALLISVGVCYLSLTHLSTSSHSGTEECKSKTIKELHHISVISVVSVHSVLADTSGYS